MDETKINNIEEENEMKETIWDKGISFLEKQKQKSAENAVKREAKKQERQEARAKAGFWARHKGELFAGAAGAAIGGFTGYWAANKDVTAHDLETEPDILDIDPVEIDGVPVAETIE